MPLNLPGVPFKLSPEDMGKPDITAALGKGMQLGYMPRMTEADIFSKTMAPLAQIASNPMLWAVMPKEQQQQIAGMISNMMARSPYGKSSQGISSLFGSNNSNVQSQGSAQQNNGMGETNFNNGYPSNSAQANNNQQGSEIPNNVVGGSGGLPPTNFNKNAPNFQVPGSMGGANPMSMAEAQKAGLQTSATTQASAQTEQYQQLSSIAAQLGNQSNLIKNNFDKLMDAYSRLETSEKGPGLGSLPAISGAADEADTASNALTESVARLRESGHLTNDAWQNYKNVKVGRSSTEENIKNTYQYTIGLAAQNQQMSPFLIAAQRKNLTAEQANAVYQYYQTQVPFYNPKTHKMNPEVYNWEDYLTPEKITEALSPKSRKRVQENLGQGLPNHSNVSEKLSNTPNTMKQGMAEYVTLPDGKRSIIQDRKKIGKENLILVNGDWYHS